MAADAAAPSADGEHLGGVDTELLQPLELAAGKGDLVSTEALLAAGVTVAFGSNTDGDRPLNRTVVHWAAFGGNPGVVTAVLQGIADRVAATSAAAAAATEAATEATAAAAAAPVVAAIAAANAAVAAEAAATVNAKSLSEAGGPTGTTPLHLAVQRNHLEAAAVLSAFGAGVEDIDGYGWSPVNFAVEENNEDMLLQLLRQGANVDSASSDSEETPLHRATSNESPAMCEVLIREGATVDSTDGDNSTPLHFAVLHQNAGAVHVLLQRGAAVDAVDDRRATPLNLAMTCQNEDVIEALLAAGADASLRNVEHHSAMFLAVRCQSGEQSMRKMMAAAAADGDISRAAFALSGLATAFAMQMTVLDESRAVVVLSVLLDMGIDVNKFRVYPDSLWKPPGGSTLLHIASMCARVAVVERLLCGGAHRDVLALHKKLDRLDEIEFEVRPADVVGEWAFLTHPEPTDAQTVARVASIRAMLAAAEFVRRRWLLALRRRYDAEAEEGLPGNGGGGTVDGPCRRQKGLAEAATAVEVAPDGATAEEKQSCTAGEAEARAGRGGEAGEAGEETGGVTSGGRVGGEDVGQVADHGAAVKDSVVFLGAGVWLGGVASPEIFRKVFGYL